MSGYNHGTPLLLGRLLSADMNSTADQAIYVVSSNYVLYGILATNASTSLTTAAGGVYTAVSKGGTAVVAAGQTYTALTGSTKALWLTIAAAGQDRLTAAPLYLSLTTGQGSAATADLYVFGYALD
jgi:hypothetical protein